MLMVYHLCTKLSSSLVWSMVIYCTTEQLTLIFVDWILSDVVLKVCAPPLSLHYPPIVRLLLLALFVNCLMVRVEEFFSSFVHISPPTVLEDLLICPLPTIPLGITVWLFLNLSSLWIDFCAAGVCLLFRLGTPYLLLSWLMFVNGVMLWRPYNITSLQLVTDYYCSICFSSNMNKHYRNEKNLKAV